MCGALATYLRMCGYDAAYALDEGVEDNALCVTERDVLDQLREIAAAG